MDISDMKTRLAEIILKKTFRYSDDPPFRLVSGRTSNYYFNCKPTMLDPEGMNLIGNIIFDMIRDSAITAIGGLTLGADPMANATALISYQKGKPVKAFIVRKDAKGHGTKSSVEGNVEPGERVAILDDVITTGGSTITAIERARDLGLDVDRVIVLVDREEGGRENIERYIDRIEPLFTRTEIMKLHQGGKGHDENQ